MQDVDTSPKRRRRNMNLSTEIFERLESMKTAEAERIGVSSLSWDDFFSVVVRESQKRLDVIAGAREKMKKERGA